MNICILVQSVSYSVLQSLKPSQANKNKEIKRSNTIYPSVKANVPTTFQSFLFS